MRRLRRILANVLTAASLLLCVIAMGLWGRSYPVGNQVRASFPITMPTEGLSLSDCRLWIIETGCGRVAIARLRGAHAVVLSEGMNDWWRYDARVPPESDIPGAYMVGHHRDVDLPGIAYGRDDDDLGGSRVLALHCAYPTVLFALAPLTWSVGFVRRRRRARRARVGLCAACEYDLRATAKGGRCPECGRAAAGSTGDATS